MDEQTNIFLRVLQIGVDRKDKTICFDELIVVIKNEFKISDDMVVIIRRWFYDFYYTPNTFRIQNGISNNALSDSQLKMHDKHQAYFTGDGFFKYYEYLEVKTAFENAKIAMENAKESSKQANKALKWVIASFVVASLVGLVQIVLMVYQSCTSP